ncbi:MAG: BatA domain-containing protein [Thermoguttaceae bacterium]|jgi:hypothetical protein
MGQFVHPLLLWGLPVVAAPVVIHLINLLRHRRVEWAAMEFLLISQRKHRTWIVLKQLLLLLLRMLAVAAVVLIVAGPLLRNQWGNLLGTQRIHHIVLVDDSFSMSDHWGDTSAFGQAKAVVGRIAAAAARQKEPQSLTLLRFSRAGQFGRRLRADFTNEPVDTDFPDRLAEKLKTMDVSETAAEPASALEAVGQLIGDDEGERRLVYLISDFRARQWDKPAELKDRLARLSDDRAEIHLIDCVDASHANLAIASLKPEEGILAAGVRWRMEVAVRNFGPAPARNVPLRLAEDGRERTPATIAEIPAGGVTKENFYVSFADPGEHRIAAHLEADAVAADNSRYAVVDLPAEMPVLLVDGDPGGRDANYLGWALLPGGSVRTGIRPRIETPRFLASHPLDEFHAILLANFDRLDRSAVEALERYVKAGGGAAFFLGEQTRSDFINRELYRDGKGVFPVPLGSSADLLVDRLEKTPDVQGEDHFLFRYLGQYRNENLGAVSVQRYFTVAKDWKPQAQNPVRTVLHLRGGPPLMVERSFEKGRVLAFLSTAAPVWNNWAANSETVSFPLVVRELCAYLARRPAEAVSHTVGEPLAFRVEGPYQPQVRFVPPSGDPAASSAVDAVRGRDGQLSATLPETDRSGFYEVQLTRTTGKPEVRHLAVNVDPSEGDLRALFGADLAARLSPEVKYDFEQATSFQTDLGESAGRNLSEFLLYLLILLLIGEQILAWSASYHPVARPAAASSGRAAAAVPAVASGLPVAAGQGGPP